jgi:hypothetical protein
MYRSKDRQTPALFPELFPLGGSLRADNRWMILADMIPWEELEEMYRGYFAVERGRPAKDSRLICGLLTVKHITRDSDEKVVERFLESPYVQWFCGYEAFVTEDEIDPSLLSKMRKRLGAKFFREFEDKLLDVLVTRKILRAGSHLLDASVIPANIEYPTDVKLLNRARVWLVACIGKMRRMFNLGKIRTYCKVARVMFVDFQKKRRKTGKVVRVMQGKMARFVARNIRQFESLLVKYGAELTRRQREKFYRRLRVVKAFYEQQYQMWKTKTRSVSNRIVSLHLPHIRPIVRGKDGRNVEFGPKVLLSWVGGFAFMDKLGFEAYNDGLHLKESLENYKKRFGKLPKDSTGDGIYGNRNNRAMLEEMGIRGGFKALGRPVKKYGSERRWLRKKQSLRNSRMEGIIGHGKNHFGLDRIRYTIPDGEEIWTRNCLMAMNLMTAVKMLKKAEAKAAA